MKKKFPDPINLPKYVNEAREDRKIQILKSSSLAILIRSLIVMAELAGFFYFNSHSLLLDAMASAVDICLSFFLIICIRFASKPPDANHPFGHGRFEPLFGLQMGIFLAILGTGMLIQQILQASQGKTYDTISVYAWILPFCAVILLEICYRIVIFASHKHKSPALAADAVHYRIDAITSFFAMIALMGAAYFPPYGELIDHLGAIVIALFMVILGILASRKNLDQLMDKTPDPIYFEKVKNAAKKVKGIRGTEKIRIQQYGPDAHVNIDVEVDPNMKVAEAHDLTQLVRIEIQKEWPAVRDVSVHVEPFYPHDH